MRALVDHFRAAGVTFEAEPDGKLLARGPLTDDLRAAIRANKPAILAELRAVNAASDRDAERRCTQSLAFLVANPSATLH